MVSATLPTRHSQPAVTAAFLLAAITVGTAFFLTEHRVMSSKLEAFGTTADLLAEDAGGEQMKNLVGFSSIAALGFGLAVWPGGNSYRGVSLLAMLIAAYLLWCAASVLWTADAWMTSKRVVVLLFCFLGAVGTSKQLDMRQLLLLTLAVSAAYVAVGVGTEVALGTFRPWESEYRFAGTMHPSGQSDNCAIVCLAAAIWLSCSKRGAAVCFALLVAAGVLLILTKSRHACLELIGALSFYLLLRTSSTVKLAVGLTSGWVAAIFVLLVEMLHAGREVVAAALLGRQEHVGTLTGRTELWEELLTYIGQRPLLGYGYGSFWSPDRIEDISATLYWGMTSAHSAYFETILNVGLIGALLLLLIVVVGVWQAASHARSRGDAGSSFLFALFVFAAINGIVEAGFVAPSFLTWVLGCGLLQLALFSPAEELTAP